MIRSGNGTVHFLHIKYGVNQGNLMAMIVYGLGILPLIQYLRTSHPSVTQPWYDDDAGESGNFSVTCRYLNNLMFRGPLRDYLPKTTKSILVMSPRNVPRVEAFFQGYVLKFLTGIWHLGGFMDT